MQVTIYNNSSDNRVVSKSIATIKTLTCEFYAESSVLNPSILVAYDETVFTANYMYIPKFGRYYYITDIQVINGRQIRIDCHVDVLMSFDVQSLSAIISRNTNNWNTYSPDGMFHVYNFMDVKTVAFPNSFNACSDYVLTVVGGN